jgi:hypothetical protein
VTYRVTATDPDGIQSIDISEDLRRFTLCSGGVKCSVPVSQTSLRRCVFPIPYPSPAQCTVTVPGYPDESHVGYRATATTGSGAERSEGVIYFAAGTYPWPDDPIPVYVRGDPAEKIDLVFIPDQDDGGNRAEFATWVTALLRDSFLSREPFAQQVRLHREVWNFYLTYTPGDSTEVFGCRNLPPANWSTLRLTVNSGFIVHKDPMRDCSGIGEDTLFGAEPIDAADPRSLTVPIHETGHSVFGLADEYQGGGLFTSTWPEHNAFKDRNACYANADAHNWPRGDCVKIGNTKWYRSDDGYDLMADTATINHMPNRSDQGRAAWRYAECAARRC